MSNASAHVLLPLVLMSLVALLCTERGRAAGSTDQQPSAPSVPHTQQRLQEEALREVVTVPLYTVFDDLEPIVDGNKVSLEGAVTSPSVKSEAEDALKRIQGVTAVEDEVEILPASPMDQQLRRAEYHAIYGAPSLQRYSEDALQRIHIVVRSAQVTLVGAVDSPMDKDNAALRAKSVPGVFSVTNNLTVQDPQE